MKKILKYTALFSTPALLFFAIVVLAGFARVEFVSLKKVAYFILFIPIAEEFIFRWFLQGFIGKKIKFQLFYLTGANLLTSTIFAGIHIALLPSVNSALVFIPSLIFGFTKERTASIVTPILIHGIFNLNVFITYSSDVLGNILSAP